MMHHPNMHHQPMSGHPPQHLAGHQAMPTHHQMPPHQMHRENRHVTLTRVPLGPSGTHGQSLGGLGALGVHQHHGAPRAQHAQHAPHAIRAMPHHPPAQHHAMAPQQMKPMRRPYTVGGGYGPGANVMPPPFAAPHQHQPPPTAQPNHTGHGMRRPPSPVLSGQSKLGSDFVVTTPTVKANPAVRNGSPGREAGAEESGSKAPVAGEGAGHRRLRATSPPPSRPPPPPPRPPPPPPQHRPTVKRRPPCAWSMNWPDQAPISPNIRDGTRSQKVFTVTLRLGDTEEYTAEGSSIKRAQHAAASAALSGTTFPPPPPRAPPAHAPHAAHHRHAGAVMPTVELNALAMKLCQPAVYTSVPPLAAPPRARARLPPPFRLPHAPHAPAAPFAPPAYPRLLGPGLIYRVRVCVGGRAWLGEGGTPQAARHDAAARALQDLRPPPQPDAEVDNGADTSTDLLNSEVKSPVSLVHELALKRNLSVQFTVKSERGPPHMRVFVTACAVGDMETEGEGNGKKVSKRRAAERMLEEMRRRWPPGLLRARPPHERRRHQPAKKKPRNLIKEGGFGGSGGSGGPGGAGGAGADNPISRLAVARHAARARSPQYRVLEERGAARRREFLVQCDAPPHRATGLGPNKKTAKRRAAHNVLLAMESSAKGTDPSTTTDPANDNTNTNGTADSNKNISNNDIKRKESDALPGGGANGEVRQPVPGVLLMDYQQRSGQPPHANGVSETSATGGSGGNTPGAKDQLMYLSQLLGFTVQFSDFPKRNHGEYLSLVSLSTEPPVMCHGGGASTAHSHEQCARAALRALALMGLEPADSAAPGMQSMPGSGAKSGVISNGISE